MRRTLLVLTAAFVIWAPSPFMTADAAASSKHKEEADGCDHGNTSKQCRPDPSPNGKDCERHGKHGGVNEDHCLSSTTTTIPAPTTTSTMAPPVTSTTATTATTTPASGSPSTTTTTAPSSSSPNLGCVTPDGHPYVTNIEQGGCTSPQTAIQSSTLTPAVSELPRTGRDAGFWAIVGLAILLVGLTFWSASKVL
jgi:LPXTG-motif cell wall-anchored protein